MKTFNWLMDCGVTICLACVVSLHIWSTVSPLLCSIVCPPLSLHVCSLYRQTTRWRARLQSSSNHCMMLRHSLATLSSSDVRLKVIHTRKYSGSKTANAWSHPMLWRWVRYHFSWSTRSTSYYMILFNMFAILRYNILKIFMLWCQLFLWWI